MPLPVESFGGHRFIVGVVKIAFTCQRGHNRSGTDGIFERIGTLPAGADNPDTVKVLFEDVADDRADIDQGGSEDGGRSLDGG